MSAMDAMRAAFGGTLTLPRWGGILASLRIARRNRITRIHLVELTDDQLRDIGITRAEALGEIRKSALL